MKVLRVAAAAFFLSCVPALAQWQVPNYSVPVGRGGGTGFKSVGPCLTGVPIVGAGVSADPACGSITAPNVNYTAPGTGGATVTQQAYNQRVLYSSDYGAVCNNTGNDATALNNLITAAIAQKAIAYIQGVCRIATPLQITGAVTLAGTGQGYNPFIGFTGSGSAIITSADVNAIEIDTQHPVNIHDLSVLSGVVSTKTGIQVTYSNGACVASCINYGSTFKNVNIAAFAKGIHFIRAGASVIDSAVITGVTTAAIEVEDTFNNDAGDNKIQNSTLTTVNGIGVNWKSGGGLIFANNKINGATIGICFCWNGTTEITGVFNVDNNSIEGTTVGIKFIRTGTSLQLVRMNFSNNELIGANATGRCVWAPTDGTGVWLYALTFTGGSCALDASAVAGFEIDSVNGFTINGVTFESIGTTAPRIKLGSAATNGVLGPFSSVGTYGPDQLNGNQLVNVTSPVNAQTGTSYAILTSDRGKVISASNAAAQAYTIGQATSTGDFQSGWFTDINNISTNAAGIVTITATTSTFSGDGLAASSTLRLGPGQSARITSTGTNYLVSNLAGPSPVLQSGALAPTGTSSSTYVMQGNGSTCTLTPLNNTRVMVSFSGYFGNNTATGIPDHRIAYGTGTAPVNGAALTGTVVGSAQLGLTGSANSAVAFSNTVIVTGLTLGTAYWFDLQQRTLVGGTSTWSSVACALAAL